MTVFAIFYVLSQAIERALTPIAAFIPTTKSKEPVVDADGDAKATGILPAFTTRSRAAKERTAAVEACADTTSSEETAKVQARTAANAQEVLQQAYVNATTVWALGAAMAFLLCARLDVYLLDAIAIEGYNPPLKLDLLVTGLAIGGGTVPLHGLIERIQKKDDKQSGNPPTSPTPGGGIAGIVTKV